MIKLSNLIVILLAGSLSLISCSKKTHVLVVAGGHSFDTTEFVDMFNSFAGISFDTLMQPKANRWIASGNADQYDVFVFYDMWQEISEEQKEGYMHLTSEGKGLVFLHHSLVSYQSWPDFREMIGGKYIAEWSGEDTSLLSNYRHDIDIDVRIVADGHPVTAGVSNFTIHDEGYGNIQVNEDVEVLLKADHPDCYPIIGWANTFGNSKIVYLMMGHDRYAYANDDFRLLLQNAIDYVR